ncbi:hypothetical protein [Caenimonas aquaedulcis]|uniref:Uncharacterized protein n=1 Tax=Caenimonas aquaedulcis TaxID=2793270 RepID=A0A931MJ27_9BURK|nr:hypothetical protein [Caenimonas aquaedulcis]MBG9390647.1 hypothetical protein [Caenimonas aquaedulcis]
MRSFGFWVRSSLLLMYFVPQCAGAQGAGSWGGAKDLAQLAIALGVLVFVVWAIVVWLVIGRFVQEGRKRLVFTLLIACSPIVYLGVTSKLYNDGLEELAQTERDVRDQAARYLVKNCPVQRKMTTPIALPSGVGIYVSSSGDASPEIANIPAPPASTRKSQRQIERYGVTYPHLSDGPQFRSPLYWTRSAYPDGVLAGGAGFVEFWDPYKKLRMRKASFRWWKENTPPLEFANLMEPYHGGIYLRPESTVTFPAGRLQSTHRLDIRDVSTLEDRQHWVARGRISLVKEADKELVAEYVGLSAAQSIISAGYGYWWEQVRMCDGPESNYLERGRWNATQFFFKEIARVSQ